MDIKKEYERWLENATADANVAAELKTLDNAKIEDALLGKGYEIKIYDKNVAISQKTNTNADFIAAKLPHLHGIITDDLDSVCSASDVLVITNKGKEFADVPAKYPHKAIVDLVRQFQTIDYEGNYEGISWGNINQNPAQNDKLVRDMATTEF